MGRISLLLIGAIVTILFNVGNGELFETLVVMDKLMEKEIVLIHKLRFYIQNQKDRLLTLRSIFVHYSIKLEETSHAINQHLSNTISTNLLVKGLMTEWQTVEKLLVENNCNVNVSNSKSEDEDEDEDEGENEKEDEDVDETDVYPNKVKYKKYQSLCNEEITLSAAVQKQLKCRYVDHGSPFLKIAPFKEEEAYLKPRIVIFHDVIYEKEIETLKRLAKPKLKRAEVILQNNNASEISEYRIAQNAWLEDKEHKDVATVKRRVEYMTKLTTNTAESLQIAYYEIGGLYSYHTDYLDEKTMKRTSGNRTNLGNRIATVLYYLNDVEQGGKTVFIELNVTLTPKKGSAAFWYNLKQNGRGDLLTMHGACPVNSGSKWVANLWLREDGQEFRRPCTLEN